MVGEGKANWSGGGVALKHPIVEEWKFLYV